MINKREDLDLLYEKAKSATVGPWKVVVCEPCADRGREDIAIWDETENLLISQWMEEAADNHLNNIEYIASASPEVIMELIERVRSLELEQAASRHVIDHFSSRYPEDLFSKIIKET